MEIPSPVAGGSCGSGRGRRRGRRRRALIRLQVGDAGGVTTSPTARRRRTRTQRLPPRPPRDAPDAAAAQRGREGGASPRCRHRARKAGIDLGRVPGSGPSGRVTHEDLDAYLAGDAHRTGTRGPTRTHRSTDIKITGVRRKIAEKMQSRPRAFPHITYVGGGRRHGARGSEGRAERAQARGSTETDAAPAPDAGLVRAFAEQPQLNALYDDEAGIIHQHGGVHIGIATQTPSGLVVPVVRHAEARGSLELCAELNRLAEAARAGTATRQELGGSTITVTSLGALGGLASTPIINHPEVAIIGVNRIVVRPVWSGAAFIPRKMMNLSSSSTIASSTARRSFVHPAHQDALGNSGADLRGRVSRHRIVSEACPQCLSPVRPGESDTSALRSRRPRHRNHPGTARKGPAAPLARKPPFCSRPRLCEKSCCGLLRQAQVPGEGGWLALAVRLPAAVRDEG